MHVYLPGCTLQSIPNRLLLVYSQEKPPNICRLHLPFRHSGWYKKLQHGVAEGYAMMILASLVAFQPVLPSNASLPKDRGWLYRGTEPRLVRFEVKSDDPGNSRIIFLAPKSSGFIFMKGETFTISIAEPLGNALLEYRKGVLSERCLVDSEGGLGDFQPQNKKDLTFEEAFSTAMEEIATKTLGIICCEILKGSDALKDTKVIHRDYGHGASSNIVLGPGRGALLSYSVTEPPDRARVSRRLTCTFTVFSVGSKD